MRSHPLPNLEQKIQQISTFVCFLPYETTILPKTKQCMSQSVKDVYKSTRLYQFMKFASSNVGHPNIIDSLIKSFKTPNFRFSVIFHNSTNSIEY